MKENRVKKILLVGLWLGGCWLAAAQSNQPAQTLDELQAQLTAHVEAPRFSGALWGVKVASLTSGKIIFEHHPERLMSPASNSKLYVGALALDHFGPDHRIVTPLLGTAKVDATGTLQGDLVISGRGDPSWNWRRSGTNFWNLFTPFISALTNAGVHRVTGDLVADATFFRTPPHGGGWAVDDLDDSEGAEISALTLNDNFTQIRLRPGLTVGEPCRAEIVDFGTGLIIDNQTVTTTNGSQGFVSARRFRGEATVHLFGSLPLGGEAMSVDMTVLRPAEWFAVALKQALANQGIAVEGSARTLLWPAKPATAAEKIGEVISPPMRELVRDFMKPSQNLQTDLIFDFTGEMMRRPETPAWLTSEQLAVQALEQFMTTNSLAASDLHFDEGSGLSRNNLTSANATVGLLTHMAQHPAAAAWEFSMPIAGVDGTIRRRMKGTAAEGNLHAKTGTLRWVNALSGYVTNTAGEKFVFSLMLNRYDSAPGRKRTDELDEIGVLLARSAFRTDEPLPKKFSALGTLVVTQLLAAPFPHPARADGFTRKGEVFSAAKNYADSTVAFFIPKGFRPSDKADLVVHFHGWRNTVAGVLEQFRLIEQFAASGKNAVLIVPQGPRLAADSFGGKLEDTNGFKVFLTEAMEKLVASGATGAKKLRVGNVILSGHSGGYHPMAAILERGGVPVREAWIFDGLYGDVEKFVSWQQRSGGRLLNIYTDRGGTKAESEKLMVDYTQRGVKFSRLEETNSVTADLRDRKITFIHTDLAHDEAIFRRNQFQKFLQTSCLKDQ